MRQTGRAQVVISTVRAESLHDAENEMSLLRNEPAGSVESIEELMALAAAMEAEAATRYAEAMQRMLVEVAPIADAVLRPKWYEEGQELFGVTLEETREFAMKALERRLKVIGLAPVA